MHQVDELRFKQLLHELGHAQDQLEDGHTAPVVHTLRRALTILKVVVAQVDVLETMAPRQVTGFRDRLDASSGFQSAQFRELEAVLGRRLGGAGRVPGRQPGPGADRGGDGPTLAVRLVPRALGGPWLRGARGGAPAGRDGSPARHPGLDDVLLAEYGDDGGPAQVCERLVDLDEGLQEWRYGHVKMVERTIGDKAGTGGSSGAAYLRSTLFTPLFPDLWAVRSRL